MIQKKKKICLKCNQERYIYARGLCGYCYGAQATRKAQERAKEKARLNPKPNKAQFVLRKPTGEAAMFELIWEHKKPHVSAVSNKPISEYEYRTRKCFAHVLSKKQYPMFRLNEDNIEYLTWDEHTFWDNRTEEELQVRINRGEDWGYMLRKEEELKAQYKRMYPSININRYI